jgi:glycosyltransferase involved in cell wall biosynthesis
MKKKICIITSSFPSNKDESINAGVFVRDFALLLAEQNFDVHVLAPKRKSSIYDDERIHVHFFPWLGGEMELSSYNTKNPIHLVKLLSVVLSGLRSTTQFVKKNKIDFCLAMWAVPAGLFAYAAKIFCKTPYSVWSLGSDILKIQDYPFGKLILKKVLKNATNLYADGLQLAKDVENISGKRCDFLASNRMLLKQIQEPDYSHFDSSKINFMFLGRYHHVKGVDLLIEAITQLNDEERKQCLFHIFGGGPLESKIKKIVKDQNLEANTFVNSYLDGNKVFSYMSKSDFVVIPSRSESIPLVLSEAVQSKKPILLTNVGDMGNLASKFNIGFIQEPNAKSIAEGLRSGIKLDQHERQSFLKGMQELEDFLDLQKSVRKFINSIS